MRKNKMKGDILIVDDMPHNLRLLSNMLITRGYSVRAVTNGKQAIGSVNLELPDIILLDINMPDMSGYDICQILKNDEQTRAIPVIFISAMDESADKVKAFEVGGVDYITKPFQIEEVVARVENQLAIRRAQEELRKSEERFRTALDFTYDWEYLLGEDHSYLYTSPACERITGYSVEEFLQDPNLLIKITHPEDSHEVEQHLHNLKQYTQVRFIEFRIYTRNGEERWISHTCRPVYDTQGNWIGTRASNRDITEQKHAEENLRKLQRAVEQSPASIVITNIKGIIEYVNPKFTQATGYTFAEAVGNNPRVLKSGDMPSEGYRKLWETIANGGEWRGEFHNRKKDGELFWESASISPIFDEQGKVTHYLAVKEDITDRKRTEDALRTAYHHLKMLNDRMHDELTMAQRIQQSLLPPERPSWHGLDVVCYNKPAREVGGDLYAYHSFDPYAHAVSGERYILAIGDISGKGMPAALLMAISMASFNSIVGRGLGVGDALAFLDKELVDYTHPTQQNCALVYAEISFRNQEMKQSSNATTYAVLETANAGCIAPVVRYTDGNVLWIDSGGLPLGVAVDIKPPYEPVTLPLSQGDMVILMSDGVIEAQNDDGDMFGFQRMEEAIRDGTSASSEAMLHHLCSKIDAFVGNTEPNDDMTIVIVQV